MSDVQVIKARGVSIIEFSEHFDVYLHGVQVSKAEKNKLTDKNYLQKVIVEVASEALKPWQEALEDSRRVNRIVRYASPRKEQGIVKDFVDLLW